MRKMNTERVAEATIDSGRTPVGRKSNTNGKNKVRSAIYRSLTIVFIVADADTLFAQVNWSASAVRIRLLPRWRRPTLVFERRVEDQISEFLSSAFVLAPRRG